MISRKDKTGLNQGQAILKNYKVYLDSCCVSRPSDNQAQNRIRCETAAIMQIISHLRNGELQSITSKVLKFEINKISNLRKRSLINALLISIPQAVVVSVSQTETLRGKQLESLGFKEYDALHLACAESGKADVFLTTDDAVISRAKCVRSKLRVRVDNPDTWLRKHRVAGGN